MATEAYDLPALIDALSRPDADAPSADAVEVHQTHISVVFLIGDFAYKIKKSVRLGFLDFSTLELRKHFCEEEVRLNRRLAPQIYLGVTPVTQEAGRLCFGGSGPVIEWAVRMKRLPPDATLESHVLRGDLPAPVLATLGQRLADFHRHAERSPSIAAFGRFDVVAQNARDNFTQTAAHIGVTVAADVHERVRSLTEMHLECHRDLIEARAGRGVPCDTHGDLHLDHVYLLADELVVIDCIEFADRFRYADPVADMAFLVMDLKFHERPDLARVFADAYFQAAGDAEGSALVPLYSAYRAVVRAKVDGVAATEWEIEPAERERALRRAQAHWGLALEETLHIITPGNRHTSSRGVEEITRQGK